MSESENNVATLFEAQAVTNGPSDWTDIEKQIIRKEAAMAVGSLGYQSGRPKLG